MLFGCASSQPGCLALLVLCCSQHRGNPGVSESSPVSTQQKQGRHPDRDKAELLASQHSPCELQELIFPFGAPGLEFQNENHILSSLFRQQISSSFLLKLSQCCKGVKISQPLAHALNWVFCGCQIGSFGGTPVPRAGCGWAGEVPRCCHTVLNVAALTACNSFRSFRVRCLSSK